MRGSKLYYENNKGEYDLIDVIQDFNLGFNRGCILKYIIRAGKKDNELQDLYKAKDYIEREIQYISELRDESIKKQIDR